MCQWHLGLRRLDAAFVIVLAFISRRRQAAAVQGASHIFMYSAEPKAQGNLRCKLSFGSGPSKNGQRNIALTA